jgi:plasmid stabilization system protein ParE
MKVKVRRRADRDVEEIRDWYDDRRDGLGGEFVTEVLAMLRSLRQNPARYPVYKVPFRRAMLERFPYKIFYQIREGEIVVFRVLHEKRDHDRILKYER